MTHDKGKLLNYFLCSNNFTISANSSIFIPQSAFSIFCKIKVLLHGISVLELDYILPGIARHTHPYFQTRSSHRSILSWYCPKITAGNCGPCRYSLRWSSCDWWKDSRPNYSLDDTNHSVQISPLLVPALLRNVEYSTGQVPETKKVKHPDLEYR